jgi:hypothetical protein
MRIRTLLLIALVAVVFVMALDRRMKCLTLFMGLWCR